MNQIKWLPFDLLEGFMRDVLVRMNVPEEDAATVAEVLITADQWGIDSHGVGRFQPIYIDRMDDGILNPVTKITVKRDLAATAVLDGGNGLGHVVSKRAMEMAIEKARVYGLGMVAVGNSSHYGIAGYYGMMAAEAGMIGLTGTNARPSIAPTFGVDNMLGTNPLTFVIPTDEPFPFFLDCATATSQRGKIEKYDRDGLTLPRGWVIDRKGEDCVDPAEVLQALVRKEMALTPLGGIGEEMAGYKGYGYATVVEILSSAFTAGPYMRMLTGLGEAGEKVPYRLGHFFIAIDVNHFIDLEVFRTQVGAICRALRQSTKAPGQARIYTPGEKEYETYLARKDKGAPVGPILYQQLLSLKKRFGLENYSMLE